eukprot:CAMPEP_0119005156 /NCGR_PEP_ID=MMETSP1176-20130426/1557_1 /TAXON_ID=265551 /ORGANISM="Synedropsis recta cf, Strain CCMP1620" /LENGTH=861 /DNA_ID=CAMNT_0006956929 /DNA_START=352 /DNA_END=2937 /DNA_ORIENTATION=+
MPQGQGGAPDGDEEYYEDEPATVTAAVTNADFRRPSGYAASYDEDDASEGSDESGLGHTRLFVMIEEGMPRPNENRPLTVAEANQRRELVEQTWEQIRKWLWAHQDPAEREAAATVRGNNDATPLHNVCKLTNPPADIVQALLEVAPETVTWADSHGWLPLHHACANGASGDVLQILTEAYPEGKTKQDSQNRTPLHFYLTQRADYNNSTVMATNIMQFLCNSGAAELPDVGGMLPMHYACAYGVSPAVLAVLQEAYPDSLIAKENKGRTPVHLAMVNAHRDASPGVISFLLEHSGNRAELVNLRDHDGYLPLHLLALGLKGFKADEPNQRNNVAECLKMYLGAEPRASADFLTALQDLPDWLQDVAVVSPHVRSILNRKIVQRFPTAVLMLDGYCLLLIIIFFEIASSANIDARFTGEETDTVVPVIILFVGGTYFLLRELVQIISLWYLGSFSSWFYDATNWLDMAVISLVYYYSVLMTNSSYGVSDEMFRSGCAFTKGVLWCAVIYFLKSTLVDFAVFVGGVYYVLQRLAAFLMAVGVILLAFAQMFYIVYTETEICDDQGRLNNGTVTCEFPHCDFGTSLLKVYTMMMGEIGDETRYDTSLVAQILYVAYAFLVVILLSNVLIAIVTDSYEIIQNDRAAIVFWSNRLDFVAETDAVSYGFLQRIKIFGSDRAGGGVLGAPTEVQESPYSNRDGDGGSSDAKVGKNYFYHGWKSIVQLFDQNLYDDIALSPQNIEFWCYFLFQAAAVLFVIPLWIVAGIASAGILWPPQIREYLFVQKETSISRADLEKSKLQQLKEIQSDIRVLKVDLKREMLSDREEMIRMKNEVDAVQTDVMSDLQQVRELMTTLLDMGRQRVGR